MEAVSCNYGLATLTNSTLFGNEAAYGGGIYNYGTLRVANSTIAGNTADMIGGGISMNGSSISSSGATALVEQFDRGRQYEFGLHLP